MGKLIDFSTYLEDDPDIDAMTREELLERLKTLKQRISELDNHEPRNMNSEEYEAWGDAHEKLEDMADEVVDRLEEMDT